MAPEYNAPKALCLPPGLEHQVEQAPAVPLQWQDFVADRRLRVLVQQALQNNRDLRQTLLNVEAVRAQYQIQRADRLPSVGLQAGGTASAAGRPVGHRHCHHQGNYQVGLGVTTFELDLFGRVRSLTVRPCRTTWPPSRAHRLRVSAWWGR